MTEINSLSAQSAFAAQVAKASLTGELLRLTQSQPGLIPNGETAQAEVVNLRQNGADFTLTLRLMLPDGKPVQLQANATQPLPPGSQVTVGQLDSSRLAVAVQQASASNIATLTQLDTRQIPIGTLLQGKVLTNQPLPAEAGQAPAFRALVSLLNSSQAGATLAIDSPRPLPVGSLLSALVQGDQSLRFVPLSGRQDQLAIAQQLLTQQGRQASLPALLGALQQLASAPSADPALSASASRLLASLPDPAQLGDAKAVAQALNNSGAFLEGKLLAGLGPGVAPDLKAQLVRLVAQILPSVPGNQALAAATLAQALPALARGARGLRFPGYRVTNWPACSRPAPPRPATSRPPGKARFPCATARSSSRYKPSCNVKKPRNSTPTRTARSVTRSNRCGVSSWPSTCRRSVRCRCRRN